jgi:hypothetical protein
MAARLTQIKIGTLLCLALMLGLGQLPVAALACSFELCRRDCPMHEQKAVEPSSCCESEAAPEQAPADDPCECVMTGKVSQQGVFAPANLTWLSTALYVQEAVVVESAPTPRDAREPILHPMRAPPPGVERSPDLGRAPPVG